MVAAGGCSGEQAKGTGAERLKENEAHLCAEVAVYEDVGALEVAVDDVRLGYARDTVDSTKLRDAGDHR